jgi:hypothetical protein
MISRPSLPDPRDAALAAVLFAATVLYLVSLPHNLGEADEALFLYEARRILARDVFYRDLYEIITPGAHYVMALLFWIFGTSIDTARGAMAVLHGTIVLAVFFGCRALGVRRELSATAAAAYLALAPPAWPVASPHWASTFLVLLLWLAALRRIRSPSRGGTVLLGILAGVLILVQQQKGAVMAAGVLALLALERGIDHRYGNASRRPLTAELVRFVAGAAAVVVPVMAVLAVRAGGGAILHALILDPMANYPKVNRAAWGEVAFATGKLASYTFPGILRWLPAAGALVLLAALRAALRQKDESAVRDHAALVVLAAFSVLSISYHPDFIHLAFVAPLFLVAAADMAERLARPLGGRLGRPVSLALSLAACAGVVVHVAGNRERLWETYGLGLETSFGRVDFRDRSPIELVERVEELLADTPSREIFCYPGYPALYLMTDSLNPIPFQLLRADYNDPEQIDAVLATLEARRVPLAVTIPKMVPGGDDRVLRWVREHYEPVEIGGKPSTLYRRRDDAADHDQQARRPPRRGTFVPSSSRPFLLDRSPPPVPTIDIVTEGIGPPPQRGDRSYGKARPSCSFHILASRNLVSTLSLSLPAVVAQPLPATLQCDFGPGPSAGSSYPGLSSCSGW